VIPGLEPKNPQSAPRREGGRPGGYKSHGGRPGGSRSGQPRRDNSRAGAPRSDGRPGQGFKGQGRPAQPGAGRPEHARGAKRSDWRQAKPRGEANGNTRNSVPRNADPFKRRDRQADGGRYEIRDDFGASRQTKPAQQPKVIHKRRGWADRMKSLLG